MVAGRTMCFPRGRSVQALRGPSPHGPFVSYAILIASCLHMTRSCHPHTRANCDNEQTTCSGATNTGLNKQDVTNRGSCPVELRFRDQAPPDRHPGHAMLIRTSYIGRLPFARRLPERYDGVSMCPDSKLSEQRAWRKIWMTARYILTADNCSETEMSWLIKSYAIVTSRRGQANSVKLSRQLLRAIWGGSVVTLATTRVTIEMSFDLQEPGEVWKPYLKGAVRLRNDPNGTYQPFVFLVSDAPNSGPSSV